ncbi:MAG: DUF4013 domain-containing protein [Methanoregula sp.]|nr:DUF4013 domain-containing protein [Methanoregula sp.]
MEFGKLVGDSFEYAKEGLVGHWLKWIVLIILTLLPMIPILLGVGMGVLAVLTAPMMLLPTVIIAVIFAIILALPLMGYMLRIYRGETPAPEVNNWGLLFGDGLKLFVVYLIYAIPILIIGAVVLGSAGIALLITASQKAANPGAMMGLLGAVLFGIVILVIVAIIIWIIVASACVRLARTNSIGEAFNFGEIFHHIGKIGVAHYIAALIIMGIIVGIVTFILNLIPYIGFILALIVGPLLAIFQARYLCLLYDSAGTA